MIRYYIKYICKDHPEILSWNILANSQEHALEQFNKRINPLDKEGTWPKEVIEISSDEQEARINHFH